MPVNRKKKVCKSILSVVFECPIRYVLPDVTFIRGESSASLGLGFINCRVKPDAVGYSNRNIQQ